MKFFYTERFRRAYEKAPVQVQRAFDRRSALLLENLRHPSLHAKKYDEVNNIWQARVDSGWRFYFTIERDTIYLLSIISHPK